jgi:integrase
VQHVPKLRKLPHRAPVADFLDFEEADKLLASAEPAWRTFLLVALKTGLRVGELLALRWT